MLINTLVKVKVKKSQFRPVTGPEGSRRLRFSDLKIINI
jgi:hypothetical protein